MKNLIYCIVFLSLISVGCTPTPQIKISQGNPLINYQIVNVVENIDKNFILENINDLTTSPPSKINLTPIQITQSGAILCEKNAISSPEEINCIYKPMKSFSGEDSAIYKKTNIRGVDSFIKIIFKVANVDSKPIAYPGSFDANPGETIVSFQLPEAFDVDHPNEHDLYLSYGHFVFAAEDELLCTKRICTYNLKRSLTVPLILTFTYQAIEKLAVGEIASNVETIRLSFSMGSGSGPIPNVLIPIMANDTFCNFIINQTSASCDINGLLLNNSLSNDVAVIVVNDSINGLDQIKCVKVMSASQNLKITCSLDLTKEIITYPIHQNILANFSIVNSFNPALSMLLPKNIIFSFSRDPRVYTKEQVFTFTPVTAPSVDILWVIDNSKSMKDNQLSLVTNFNSFISNFTPLVNGVRTSPFSFNMAAITTDAYLLNNEAQGALCPFIKCSLNGNPFLLNDTLAITDFDLFLKNFNTVISRGVLGNGSERSVQSLKTFFNKNSNWHNPNSQLAIIMVSDEMEQSYNTLDCPLDSNPSTECTALRLKSSIDTINLLSPNPDLVNVFSIIDSNSDFGGIYKGISDKFQGSSWSILTPFNTILSQIGSSITSSLLSYTLIFQGTLKNIISVKINGVSLPNINNQDYEVVLPNKIKLKKSFPVGAVLTVNFDYTNND